jgi:uridylate kinase
MGSPYKRVVVKISGNILYDFHGIASEIEQDDTLTNLLTQIKTCQQQGVELVLVFGGGNICRGKEMVNIGVKRFTADNVGMLATLINSLLVREKLTKMGAKCLLLSSFHIEAMCQQFEPYIAVTALENGEIVICAGGTGTPFVTTDSAAAMRGIQTDADAVIKLTNVEGLYDKDPDKYADAKLLRFASYDYCVEHHRKVQVMDLGAFNLCRIHHLPIHIASFKEPNVITRIVNGGTVGTLVAEGEDK